MPITVLFDEFARTIPVHSATRFWTRGGQNKTAPALAEQRWALLLHTLRLMDVTFDPPVSVQQRTQAHARVTPYTRPCPGCGTPHFGWRLSGCGCRSRRRQ